MDLVSFLGQNFQRFWEYTGFANATPEHFVMLAVGLLFIWLAIKKNFEPLLLVPIGFGILVGNIPFKLDAGLEVGIYEQGSVLNILYDGVSAGWYPPLIFLGIGAMTDFSALIANPKLMLIGACRTVRHLRRVYRCHGHRFRTRPGWRHRHHRRRRRSYGNLPVVETCAKLDGSNRRVGILLWPSCRRSSHRSCACSQQRKSA